MASPRATQHRPRSDPPSPNGRNAHGGSVTVGPPPRRVRLPEVVIGVLITGFFALGAVLWHLSAVDKSPVLAVAAGLERGDTITAADIEVVYVASDDPIARLDDSQTNLVVGGVALVDLAPGTLLTRSVVAPQPTIGEGEGVVGLSLEPGGYPAMGLSPGDRVNVVRTASAADTEGGATETVVVRNATVFAVQELASDRRLVSILAPESDAEAVAAAAGSGSLRLVLVSP